MQASEAVLAGRSLRLGLNRGYFSGRKTQPIRYPAACGGWVFHFLSSIFLGLKGLKKRKNPLLLFVVIVLLLTISFPSVISAHGPGTFTVGEIAIGGGITFFEIHHHNFTAHILKSGTLPLMNISRRTANSASTGPGVIHNKSTIAYPGDVLSYYLRDSAGKVRDTLFLQRPMIFYNITTTRYQLTTSNAVTSSCALFKNTSLDIQIDCTYTDAQGKLIFSYRANNFTTQLFSFNRFQRTGNTNLLDVAHYNYYDYDVAVAGDSPDQETQDEFFAVINASKFGPGTEEQLVREGRIVCDDDLLDPNNVALSKCVSADKDTFTIKQKLGTGISGTIIFLGTAISFSQDSIASFLAGFVNPDNGSIDTDNKREVPPEYFNYSSQDLINKYDVAFAVKLEDGDLLEKGAGYIKFFGNSYGSTDLQLGASATEGIAGRKFAFFDFALADNAIIDAFNGSGIIESGAYRGINITVIGANTGTENIINANVTCVMNNTATGEIVVQDQKIFNLSAGAPFKKLQCGGTINQDNAVPPGNYSVNWIAHDTFDEKVATQNFKILKDFEGTFQSFLQVKNFSCNEQISLIHNLSNVGNINFTANLTVQLSYDNGTFFRTITDATTVLAKNQTNPNTTTFDFCDARPQGFNLNLTYLVSDENNGTKRYSNVSYLFVLGNPYHTFRGSVVETLLLGRGENSALFRRYPQGTSNLYVSDADSSLNFGALQALGRTKLGLSASLDFDDLDDVFNLTFGTTHEITVASLFSTNGETPKETRTFDLDTANPIENMPVANSTTGGNFTIGILWDTSDDIGNDGEFDSADKEDIAFITKVNNTLSSSAGVFDYSIDIPVFLRELKNGGLTVSFFVEVKP